MKARARVVHREDLHRRRHGRSPRGNAIRLDARRVKDATRTARSILRHTAGPRRGITRSGRQVQAHGSQGRTKSQTLFSVKFEVWRDVVIECECTQFAIKCQRRDDIIISTDQKRIMC